MGKTELEVKRDFEVDPKIRALIPPLQEDERASLEASIAEEGCRDRLVIWEEQNILLDGYTRLEICEKLGKPYQTTTLSFGSRPEAEAWVLENQLARRNLTDDQRAAAAVELQERLAKIGKVERAKAGRAAGGDATPEQKKKRSEAAASSKRSGKPKPKKRARTRAAQAAKVSEHKMKQAAVVKKKKPELLKAVRNGDQTLAGAVRETKREEAKTELESLEAKTAQAIEGAYDVLVIDPPWPATKIEWKERRDGAEADCPSMTLEAISAIKIPAHENAHIFLWTPSCYLPAAIDVVEAWGCNYICTFVCRKPGGHQLPGMPEHNCEFVLYARKGSPRFGDTKGLRLCFDAPRSNDPGKPIEFYEMIAKATRGQRLDMFPKRPIEGFDGWPLEGEHSAAQATQSHGESQPGCKSGAPDGARP